MSLWGAVLVACVLSFAVKLAGYLVPESLMAGERILVTGGGTGLGREMAEAFLKLGATVYICGRRQNKLDETAAELTAAHGGKIVGGARILADAGRTGRLTSGQRILLVGFGTGYSVGISELIWP